MGKSKKSNLIMTKKVPLENQLMDGKVKKGKNKHTVRLRTEETAASIGLNNVKELSNELYLNWNLTDY